MSFELVPAGKSLPDDFNVVIEIPMNSGIKYEIDKDSNALFVDRLVSTAMYYPCNYGYIPNTLCGDGDAADVVAPVERRDAELQRRLRVVLRRRDVADDRLEQRLQQMVGKAEIREIHPAIDRLQHRRCPQEPVIPARMHRIEPV